MSTSTSTIVDATTIKTKKSKKSTKKKSVKKRPTTTITTTSTSPSSSPPPQEVDDSPTTASSSSKRRRTEQEGDSNQIDIFAAVSAPSETTEPTKINTKKQATDHDEEERTPLQDASKFTSFDQLQLAPWIVKQCAAVGMTAPTEVQLNCIPQILKGSDVCGYAKTGSGKTAAFALPILQCLSKDPYGIFAVTLTPTRELAVQIGEQFTALGHPIGLRCSVIVGGLDMHKQGLALAKRPHVIVATPGRLADHICSGEGVRLSRVKFLVLDEADRLLDNESFGPDLETIFSALPKSKQTLLFSATAIAKNTAMLKSLRHPVVTFEIKSDIATVTKLKQEYLLCPAHVRHCYFINLMQTLKVGEDKNGGSCIVFAPTCKSCEELMLLLQELNIKAVALHSEMSQSDRLANLARFRSSYVKILIATDVASRGLDIAPVGIVVNFNIPKAVNDYIHRVGRTARAGRDGRSVTLMSEHDVELLQAVEERIGVKMKSYEDFKEDTVLRMLSKVNVARRAVKLKMLENNFGHRKQKRKDAQMNRN